MSKRFMSLVAMAGALAVGALVLPGAAGATVAPPTMTVALHGTQSISVSGNTVSGAVTVVSTFSGKAPTGPNANEPSYALVRLNPGVSIQQAFAVVQSHRGDINALTPFGAILVAADAPGSLQTVLTPGNYVAVNTAGNGHSGFAEFTVTQSSSPASLPAANATQTALEFGFTGPSVLHDGTIVRAANGGWLVHMINLIRVPNATVGRTVMSLLRAGKDHQAQKLLGTSPVFVSLLDPASPGAMQQQVLNTKPGYYVEACFMDTQDHRGHAQLGMLRLVRVVGSR